MIRLMLAALAALPLITSATLAQHAQPYAGLQARAVKALSPEQTADLKAGRGMGLALAAELNGYPGPLHVIELAEALALSDAQRARAQELFAGMKAETIPLGEKLIAAESDLDRLFATRTITPVSLDAVTATIGATQARLRAAHLRYHLAMMDVLTPAQVRRYNELRGYAASPAGHRPGMHQHRH